MFHLCSVFPRPVIVEFHRYVLTGTVLLLAFCGIWSASPVLAQLPFYTDDPAVTEAGKLHFEFFNEVDALQSSQYPNLRQNTANFKLNYGLPYRLELDVDAPYLSIFRAVGARKSTGSGDTDLGVKWNFRRGSQASRVPALEPSRTSGSR
jgi:hypothetical protein